MAYLNVEVPLRLLLDERLTAADKLVWMIMRLDKVDHTGPKLASPTRLAERAHLSRITIYNSLKRLTATGWYNGEYPVRNNANRNDRCDVPANLLRSTALLPRDIVMYGLLKAGLFKQQGKLTYLALSKYAQLDVKTVRRSLHALAQTGWIKMEKASVRAPIHFRLANPRDAYRREIERRINTFPFKGEAIGREIVLFLLQQADFEVNPRPSWLTSHTTGALLEIDLYIPKFELAMEFQGEQHYNETDFSTPEEVTKQQARDAEKAKLLEEHHTKLLVLKDEDLFIDKIKLKLFGLAPLRDLEGLEPIQYYLDGLGHQYQKKAMRKKAEREAQRRGVEQTQQQAPAQA
jgi:predicted transcriptional regulator